MCGGSSTWHIGRIPIATSFADKVGGYCMQPNQCLCREGYSGENCSEGENIPYQVLYISITFFLPLLGSMAVTSSSPTPPPSVTENNVLPPYLIVAIVLMIVSVFISVSTIIVLVAVYGRRKLKKKHKRHVNTADNIAYQDRGGQVITDEALYDTIDDTNVDELYSYATLPTAVTMDSNKAYNPLSDVFCDEIKLESNAAYDTLNTIDNRESTTNYTETETIANAVYDSTQGNTLQ